MMLRPILPAAFLAALLAAIPALPRPAASAVDLPPDIAFLPPDMAPRDLCNAPPDDAGPPDYEVERGDRDLTDEDRIRYLQRDIATYRREDAARFFDFVDALIARRAAIDPDYAGIAEMLDRVDLHLRAGRFESLAARGLVPDLVALAPALGAAQRVVLAQYLRSGVGIAPDPAGAQRLLRAAAYDGHAEALLEIARLQMLGTLVDGWDAPLDLTVTMAFGGMLGSVNPGICGRAEKIARAYLRGEVVKPNPDIALAWRRFAADMGGVEAAWRVVEHHLSAPPARKDNAEMRRYLRRAVDLGLTISDKQADRIAQSGALTAEELGAMIGFNHDAEGSRAARSVVPYLQMTVNRDGVEADEDGLYLDYLREISRMPQAPGRVFRDLAHEVSVRVGRWKAEPEVMALLEEAVRRGDEEGLRDLAVRVLRYRDDPAELSRAENLLIAGVEEWSDPEAAGMLDALHRCQAPDAPRQREAGFWGARHRATNRSGLSISATDLIALDPYKEPETIALIQTRALEGGSGWRARQAQRIHSQPFVPDSALRFWADQVDRSDQALEAFAVLELELATTSSERAQAVELFRRVYVNNGVTTALDLAIALVEHHGRDPETAEEVVQLLVQAGHRGEGAAIRLLSRLKASDWPPEAVYREFAQIIEDRGDFLALMFAIPFLEDRARFDDYIDRAVALMTCRTKDAEEIGDAYAIWEDPGMAYHWSRIGLAMEGGHVLSKLRLSDEQMGFWERGRAADAEAMARRAAQDGAPHPHRRLFAITADPGRVSHDVEDAAVQLVAGLDAGDMGWALRAWRRTTPDVRVLVTEARDIDPLYRVAAEQGDAAAMFELGMLLRERADGRAALAESLDWLQAAANAGHDGAMVELAFALGFGLGAAPDPVAALDWLGRAEEAGHPQAADMTARIRLAVLQAGEATQ